MTPFLPQVFSKFKEDIYFEIKFDWSRKSLILTKDFQSKDRTFRFEFMILIQVFMIHLSMNLNLVYCIDLVILSAWKVFSGWSLVKVINEDCHLGLVYSTIMIYWGKGLLIFSNVLLWSYSSEEKFQFIWLPKNPNEE